MATTVTPTDPAYRALFDGTDALETYDIDMGRDICDAFERDVAELAYLDLRMHGGTISVRHAALEFELYSIAAAERLTERIDDDCPW